MRVTNLLIFLALSIFTTSQAAAVTAQFTEGQLLNYAGQHVPQEQLVGEYLLERTDNYEIVIQKRMLVWWSSARCRVISVRCGGYQFRFNLDERRSSPQDTRSGYQDIRSNLPPGFYYKAIQDTTWTSFAGTQTFNGVTVTVVAGRATITTPTGESILILDESGGRYINLYLQKDSSQASAGLVTGQLTPQRVLGPEYSAQVSATADDLEPRLGGSLNYAATATLDSWGTTQTFAWDLDDDGQFDDSASQNGTHTFQTSGLHTISLQVTNGLGYSQTDSFQVGVQDPLLDRYQHVFGGDIAGALVITQRMPVDGDHPSVDSPLTDGQLTFTYNGITFDYEKGANPEIFRILNGDLIALDLGAYGTSASGDYFIQFSLDGTFTFTDNAVPANNTTGTYSLTHNHDYLNRTIVLGGDLSGALKLRMPISPADGTTSFGFEGFPASVLSVKSVGSSVFPTPSGITGTYTTVGGELSGVQITQTEANEVLALASDGTFTRHTNGLLTESGTYTIGRLENTPQRVESFTSNTIQIMTVPSLTYRLQSSNTLNSFTSEGSPTTGDGTMQSLPAIPSSDPTRFFRVKIE